MQSDKLFRRQVLRGAGGFALALPLLPSLQPRNAHAASGAKRFVAFATDQGGSFYKDTYPERSTLTHKESPYPGHEIGWGPLPRRTEGGLAKLSNILSAPESQLTERLIGKMNVICGLDVPYYLSHHTGGHLGCFARNDRHDPGSAAQPFIPTIDQVMAWSPKFYPRLDGIKHRSIVTGRDSHGVSFGHSNPSAGSGMVQKVSVKSNLSNLFNDIFQPMVAAPSRRTPIVDRVMENYKDLREGNRRLSVEDRRRLDDHMSRLAELQRSLTVVRGTNCTEGARPELDGAAGGLAASKNYFGALNDIIATAFSCDTTRIIVFHVKDTFSNFTGSWHQSVAHQNWQSQSAYDTLIESYRQVFRHVFVDLIAKLDVDAGQGRTILDDSLVQWTQECGPESHMSISLPVITAGSAGGFFRTGMFVDYRNMTTPAARLGMNVTERIGDVPAKYAGLLYQSWLGTALAAMGIPRADWEKPGVPGYGNNYSNAEYRRRYASGVWERGSEVLPFLQA